MKKSNNDQSGSGIDEVAPTSPRAASKDEAKTQKSPEQSSQILEEQKPIETTAEAAKKYKVTVPCKNAVPISAHVKQISDILLYLSQIQSITDKSAS